MPIDDSKYEPHCPGRSRRLGQQGFTLIELVMVLVLIGVLAVFAAPRIFNSSDFYARGFHDETLALLRYAQKTAIAQRRTVCVTFPTASSATLSIASATPTPNTPTPTCAPSSPLRGPGGESPATITGKSGVTYSAATNFNFDGLGQPIKADGTGAPQANPIIIQVNNAANAITVETVTGYVHE